MATNTKQPEVLREVFELWERSLCQRGVFGQTGSDAAFSYRVEK